MLLDCRANRSRWPQAKRQAYDRENGPGLLWRAFVAVFGAIVHAVACPTFGLLPRDQPGPAKGPPGLCTFIPRS
jgi:hypothetical protein